MAFDALSSFSSIFSIQLPSATTSMASKIDPSWEDSLPFMKEEGRTSEEGQKNLEGGTPTWLALKIRVSKPNRRFLLPSTHYQLSTQPSHAARTPPNRSKHD